MTNANIILQGRSPNVVNALAGGAQAAQLVNAIRHQNALSDFSREHGAAAAQGDQGAINALAGLDYGAAMDLQGAHNAEARATRNEARADRQLGQADRRLGISEQQLQLAKEQGRRAALKVANDAAKRAEAEREIHAIRTLGPLYQEGLKSGDMSAFNQAAQADGITAESFPVFIATAEGLEEGMRGSLMKMVQPEAPKPLSTPGKVNADIAAGLLPADTPLTNTGVTINNNPAGSYTPFQKKTDEAFSADYLEWNQGGGADALKNLTQIKGVINRLDSGENLTGGTIGVTPDIMLAMTNPAALDSREAVEEVVQRNLRLILGAQFTNEEGKRLIARAYNPKLPEAENAKRLRSLFTQMEIAAQQKQAMVDYVDQNGTLVGYTGRKPTVADFESAIGDPAPAPTSVPDGVDPDLWEMLTPEERALWD